MVIEEFLNKISLYILNPIIILAFGVAFLIFMWGIVQFILKETADENREEGKRKIFWGLFGMFIMFSVYGLINLILGTFGIPKPGFIPL